MSVTCTSGMSLLKTVRGVLLVFDANFKLTFSKLETSFWSSAFSKNTCTFFTFTELTLLTPKALAVLALIVLSRLKDTVLLLVASAPATVTGMFTETSLMSASNAGNNFSLILLQEVKPMAQRLPIRHRVRIRFFM